MIEAGKEGLLFESGNPKALAEAIEKIWLDKTLAEKLSKEGRKRAHKVHNPEENYNQLMKIYQEMLS